MKFIKPQMNQSFMITSAPDWPSILFQTDQTGPHKWSWTIKWGQFIKSGTATTQNNSWDAKEAISNCGGTLAVRADANKASAQISVLIRGQNPSSADVDNYLRGNVGNAGFEKIIAQESRYKHFNSSNEPIKSFDGGYGMCQLTKPVPTFEQVWNWKLNVAAGLVLFGAKRTSAITYLSQSGRSYTTDQLKYETVCRWNGGSYHEWDSTSGGWIRHPNILCDSKTGNIGWDMADDQNKGKTEEQLHKRDSGGYSKHAKDAHWKYFGPCYADHVLGAPVVAPPQVPLSSPLTRPFDPTRITTNLA
jgi:hypothetical protein